MRRSLAFALVSASLPVLWACETDHVSSRSATPSNSATSVERMDDQYEVAPARDSVAAVMHAKLAHAQAILEAIALADYPQAETNAMALKRISETGDWLAQESATYFDFSVEFRNVCDDMANHARSHDARALTADYATLTNTCVACHDYLRRERQSKDMPGRVSMRETAQRGGQAWLIADVSP